MIRQIIDSHQGVTRRVLNTGESGAIGQSFINTYRGEFEFHTLSRSGDGVDQLLADDPTVRSQVADTRDQDGLTTLFREVQPDVVIRAAAMKSVNQAEIQPSAAIEINVLGTLNVVKASLAAEVPFSVAFSTDKACHPKNICGYSKKITEQIWLEHNSAEHKFVCARLSNVAASAGSVNPIWIKATSCGETLKLTDSRMNRLIYSAREASELTHAAMEAASVVDEPFVPARKMRAVNWLQLATLILEEFVDGRAPDTIGLRPVGRFNEIPVSESELSQAYETYDGLQVMLHSDALGNTLLRCELSSLTAADMSVEDIRALYAEYGESLRVERSNLQKMSVG